MKWVYRAMTVAGNIFEAVHFVSEFHPEWDVIAMEFNGGGYTVIVYRLPKED